jgi:hypothetical protein
MSLKKTAEDLLEIAEAIEKEAAEVTKFVCGQCNHTTTLSKINASRKAAAEEVGENVAVSDVTVNDTVTCPACEGTLSYTATEDSEAYYFDEKEAKKKPADGDEGGQPTHTEPDGDEGGQPTHTKPDGDEPDGDEPDGDEPDGDESGEGKSKKASIDYDKLDRYLRG